jgi:hypothetical protein
MNFINGFALKIKGNKGLRKTKLILCTFFIFMFVFNVLYFNDNYFQKINPNNEFFSQDNVEFNVDEINLAAGPEIFQDPFKVNFSDIWSFFKTNYESDLALDLKTYLREGNYTGDIIDDKVYPIDNLLLYKTLLKDDTDAFETFDTYLKLKKSPLWYQSSTEEDAYGFVRAVDNTTGQVFDDNRYLTDNLMPIFLLIENIGYDINSFTIGSTSPKDSIEEIFNLINSTQFWDDEFEGFYDHNTTTTTDKYTESNMHAVLAMLQIQRIYEEVDRDSVIQKRALELANITMKSLVDKLWDNTNGGFEYYRLNNWGDGAAGYNFKHLQTNALGIITLLEYWIESGMQKDSLYLQNATYLFDKLEVLWNSGFKAYERNDDINWGGGGGADSSIELEPNAVMMSACLKLFEYTGNITYYNRAWQLFNTFESSFYDGAVNSYNISIDPVNNDKNLYANLKLCEAYLNAYDIYNSTTLNSFYNLTDEIPDYIFNQDTLNITSIYSFIKSNQYYNVTTKKYEKFTIEYNIDNATINYIFKNPENLILNTKTHQITENSTTLLYNITDTFEIGHGYYLQLYVNCSNFGTAHILKQFNVISGLINHPIQGLPDILYQGPISNIIIPVNNTRNNDIDLTVYMEGDNIINKIQDITFNTLVLTNVSFNLATTLGATIGPHTLSINFKNGTITYLEIIIIIDIGQSFDYTNLIYESSIVSGESAFVSMNLINFLPDNTQTFNVSFFEDDFLILKEETLLSENEIKSVYYNLNLSDTETHLVNVTMEISKASTVFYTKQFNVEIIQKFEILSVFFPEIISQGVAAQFIMMVQNNQEQSESFTLYMNGALVDTNIDGLGPGINRIVTEVIPSINPYDFGTVSYIFELRDSSGETIAQYYFEVRLELSPSNLVFFYIVPILIPIGVILLYKNKEIKHRLLRR